MPLLIAFLSGVAIESVFSLGVIAIANNRRISAAVTSMLWGVSLVAGVDASGKSFVVAATWCVGLGVGTTLGMWINTKFRSGE